MKWLLLPAGIAVLGALGWILFEARFDRSPRRGRGIYEATGCRECHAVASEPRAAAARAKGTVFGENVFPRSAPWHRAHLNDPRSVVGGSTMPAFPRFFETNPAASEVREIVARCDTDDGGLDDDGLVCRAEYERSEGTGWDSLLARLDNGDGVIGPSDAAPRWGTRLDALVAFLGTVENVDPPDAIVAPARPSFDALASIARGRAQFQQHCAGCHGKDADGDGPAAGFFGAHAPRNFRRGEYACRSTSIGRAPADADLFETIRNGYGPSMPGWRSLADEQVWDLVEYLKSEHPGYLPRELLVRDDAGKLLAAFVHEPQELAGAASDTAPLVLPEGTILKRAGQWMWRSDGVERPIDEEMRVEAAGRTLVFSPGVAVYDWLPGFAPDPLTVESPPIPYTRESAAFGARVYERLRCARCHGAGGAGDGPLAAKSIVAPGRILRPSDLTRGPRYLKTGRVPRAIVRLLRTGMEGAPMPSFAESLRAEGDDAAWHLAHHVLALAGVPFER